MMKQCKHCKGEFKTYDHRRRYCTRQCYDNAHKTKTPPQKCEVCSREFQFYKPKRRFCSKECRLEYGWMNKDPSKKSIFTCEWCNKEFETWTYRQPRFCSKKCAAHYGGNVGGRPRNPENYVIQQCQWCSKEYETTIHQIRLRNGKYCSKECAYDAMSKNRMGKNNPNYNGGHVDNYGPNWNRQKRKAIRRDRHTCQICGYKSGGDTILDVHHIVPIKTFVGNYHKANSLENLVCLCRNCHTKVEHGKIPCPTF